MVHYRPKDHFYHKAKEMGLASRASFKLEELLQKYQLVHAGDTALDLGAAPGGWTQILAKTIGKQGKLIAIDLEKLNIQTQAPIVFLQGDIQSPAVQQQILSQLAGKKVTAIFSDMSPKLTGIHFKDAYDSFLLAELAFSMATKFLKKGGHLVFKIFVGEDFQKWQKELSQHFAKLHILKPKASRMTSKEQYVIGQSYIG